VALVGRDPVLETLEGEEERREEKEKMLRRMNASRYDHVTLWRIKHCLTKAFSLVRHRSGREILFFPKTA